MTDRSPERTVAAAITLLAVIGLPLGVVVDGAAFYAVAAWVVLVPIVLWPRTAVPLLLAFLAVQEPIAAHFKDSVKPLYGALRSFDELAMIGAAVRLACLSRHGGLTWLRWKDWRWAAVFVAMGIVSSLAHWSGIGPAALGLFLSCRFFAFVLLAWSVPWQHKDAERLMRVLTWSGPVMLVIGFLGFLAPEVTEAVLPNDISEDEFSRSGMRSFRAPFLNPGVFGWACAVAALAALAVWLVTRNRKAVFAAGCAIVGVLVSLRRKPLVSLPIALAAAVAQLNRRQKAYLLVGVVVFASAAGYWGADYVKATIDDTVANYLDPDSREETARGALTALAAVVAQRYAPLGAGFGRFGSYPSVLWYSSIYEEYGLQNLWGFSEDHPYYLLDVYWPHLLAEVGYLGTFFMLLWFWSLWKRLRTSTRKLDATPVVKQLALFATMMLAEALVESVAMAIFETPLPSLAIALPIGMVLRLADQQKLSGATDELAVPDLEHQQRVKLPPPVVSPREVLS